MSDFPDFNLLLGGDLTDLWYFDHVVLLSDNTAKVQRYFVRWNESALYAGCFVPSRCKSLCKNRMILLSV